MFRRTPPPSTPSTTTNGNGNGHPPASAGNDHPLDTALEQLATMKEQMRASLGVISTLTLALREYRSAQKASARDLHTVRTTLRSLQKVEL